MVYFRHPNKLWSLHNRRRSYRNLEFFFVVSKDPQKSDDWLFPTSMYLGPLREFCEERIFWRKHTWQEKGWETGVFKGSKLEVFKTRWLNCRDIRWYCWMTIRLLDQSLENSHGDSHPLFTFGFSYMLAAFQASKISSPKGELYTMIT